MRRTFLRMQSEYAKTVKSGNPDESLNLGADADLSSMSLEQVTKLYRFASNDLISRDTQAATDALYDQLISEYQAQQAGVPEATRQRRQAELADLEPDRTPGWFRSPVSQAYRQHMDANQDDSGAYAGGGQVRQVADFLHDLAARRGGTLNVGGKELKPEELMAKVLQSGVDLSTGQRLRPVPSDPNDEQSVAQAKQALKDAQTAAKALLAQALALK
jgi:hypothetical protein